MEVYAGSYLNIQFEEENNRFINSWTTSPNHVEDFKSELIQYRKALEDNNPSQIIWLQQNFKFPIDVPTKIWVEENILKPRFYAGHVTADKDGFHSITFVVGHDVLAHMKVIGVFDAPSPSVFNPKHFATEQARDWLDNGFVAVEEEEQEPQATYKGVDKNGQAVIELKVSPSEITGTIKSFKTVFEENAFMKKNLEKYITLSKREKEVLSEFGKGLKHQEIADNLYISRHTVRDHIKSIRQKLEIKDTLELHQYYNAYLKK